MVFAWTPSARRHGRRRAGMSSCSVLPPRSRAHHSLPDHPAAPGDLPQAGTRRRLGRGAGARSRIRSAGGCRPMGHGNFATSSNAASSTACSIRAKTARSASSRRRHRRRMRWPRSPSKCADGYYGGSPAALCSSPRRPATCSAGRMAASPWMRRCALPARIAPGWSACCATVPARGPRAWDGAPEPAPDWDLAAQPEPEPELDQRITWSSPSPAGGGAETPRFATVRHDPGPTPARRFGPQRAAREVGPPVSGP